MRILQVGKFSEDSPGGIETALFNLCDYLSRDNLVEVVTSAKNQAKRDYSSGNLKKIDLPARFTLFSTPFTPSLITYLKKNKGFDIIQISLPNPMAVIAYLLARPQGKLIIWYHSDIAQSVLNTIFMPFLTRILRSASCIIVTSRRYTENSRTLNQFRHKVIDIPYGINTAIFNDQRSEAEALDLRKRFGTPIILFIGRLVYYKGLVYLFRAMKGIDARLLIIGDGVLRNKLEALAKKTGIREKIIFEGSIPNKSIARYILASDLLVLPSTHRSEAFGIALLEAMACAKPVVTTEIGTGTSFACLDEVNGIVVPPRDPSALAEAMNKILSSPEYAKRLGEAGRRRVEDNFTLEKMGEAFLRLYKRVLDEDKKDI